MLSDAGYQVINYMPLVCLHVDDAFGVFAELFHSASPYYILSTTDHWYGLPCIKSHMLIQSGLSSNEIVKRLTVNTNQWNRNPQPQLEPQIISLETCNIN